jgi:hypothetical protein
MSNNNLVVGKPTTIDSAVVTDFDVVGFIMAFEMGDEDALSQDDIVTGFQHLIDSGAIYGLQGFYGRYASMLADEGFVTWVTR